jgi:hypothetical protein
MAGKALVDANEHPVEVHFLKANFSGVLVVLPAVVGPWSLKAYFAQRCRGRSVLRALRERSFRPASDGESQAGQAQGRSRNPTRSTRVSLALVQSSPVRAAGPHGVLHPRGFLAPFPAVRQWVSPGKWSRAARRTIRRPVFCQEPSQFRVALGLVRPVGLRV